MPSVTHDPLAVMPQESLANNFLTAIGGQLISHHTYCGVDVTGDAGIAQPEYMITARPSTVVGDRLSA